METKRVTFKIYKNKELYNKNEYDEYNFNLNEKIIDIKKKILDKTFENKFNYLDLENITEKIYKDYGKLFFDLGKLPQTIDNYKLEQFTNDSRTFLFIGLPCNNEIKEVKNNIKNNFLTKKMKEERMKKDKNVFYYNDNDFPPL